MYQIPVFCVSIVVPLAETLLFYDVSQILIRKLRRIWYMRLFLDCVVCWCGSTSPAVGWCSYR